MFVSSKFHTATTFLWLTRNVVGEHNAKKEKKKNKKMAGRKLSPKLGKSKRTNEEDQRRWL